jgi:hypothetical protein
MTSGQENGQEIEAVNKTRAKKKLSSIDVRWWLTESPAGVGVGAAIATPEATTTQRVLACSEESCSGGDVTQGTESSTLVFGLKRYSYQSISRHTVLLP